MGGAMATVMGIALIALGACVLVSPVATGTITVIMIGMLMAAAGIAEFIGAFRAGSRLARASWLLAGFVTAVCGVLLAAHPIMGLGFLTALLALYFLADGAVKIAGAVKFAGHRLWLACGGALSLLLSYLISANWPLSGGWAIGILVGINLIYTGILVLVMGEVLV
jgi:uncharacterized membrane protein HdeD (DUF308 family)